MEKITISSGWKIAIVGGCAFVALCGMSILVLTLVSVLRTPVAEQPLYSDSAPSYESAPQQEPDSAPQTSIHPDLVGHWLFTDILLSGDFSLVTDYHLVFGSDGKFASYYNDADLEGQDYVEGNWSATETVINITLSDGSTDSYGYKVVDGTLIFEGTPDQFWERIDP